jgi:hypothetical protein
MKQLTLETLRTPIEPTAFVINHLTVSSISIVSTVSCTQIYRFSHSPVELERKRGGIGLRVRAVPTGGTDGREQTHRRTGPGGGAAGPTMREHRARGGPLPWLWPVYFDLLRGGRTVRRVARFAIRARRWLPREAPMPHERCLITARLAGPCASCRQPAWPVHAQSDGRILCADCCACGRSGAQAAGTDAAPGKPSKAGPGHDTLAADRGHAEKQARNRPSGGRWRIAGVGEGETYHAARNGAFLRVFWPRPRPGRAWPASGAGPQHAAGPAPQGLARENVSAPGCSGRNFTEEER